MVFSTLRWQFSLWFSVSTVVLCVWGVRMNLSNPLGSRVHCRWSLMVEFDSPCTISYTVRCSVCAGWKYESTPVCQSSSHESTETASRWAFHPQSGASHFRYACIVLIATISFAQKYLHNVFMIPVASPALGLQNTRLFLYLRLCARLWIPYNTYRTVFAPTVKWRNRTSVVVHENTDLGSLREIMLITWWNGLSPTMDNFDRTPSKTYLFK